MLFFFSAAWGALYDEFETLPLTFALFDDWAILTKLEEPKYPLPSSSTLLNGTQCPNDYSNEAHDREALWHLFSEYDSYGSHKRINVYLFLPSDFSKDSSSRVCHVFRSLLCLTYQNPLNQRDNASNHVTELIHVQISDFIKWINKKAISQKKIMNGYFLCLQNMNIFEQHLFNRCQLNLSGSNKIS